MFEGKTIWEVIHMGGFTMYMLMVASVISLGVFLERMISFQRKTINRREFMDQVRSDVEKGDIRAAVKFCETLTAPVASVVRVVLLKSGHENKILANTAEREIMIETAGLERNTSVVGTIGNIAVYIGLFGTVLGIVRAFHNMSQIGSGGISVVIAGVAEALICTAAGLSVAIPSVVLYNYFLRRVDRFVIDMQYCASETMDLLIARKNQ